MIVKNESRIIRRLLESVIGVIDTYCICDTGSTDDTIDKIRAFFEERGIPGTIVQEPFVDFGYNRTFALKACESMSPCPDYILLLDADMVLDVRDKEAWKRELPKSDVHYLLQGSDTFMYKNIRIVKSKIGCTYKGVTHEYVDIPGNKGSQHLIPQDIAFIKDIGDGGSKVDKFSRDIALLKRGLDQDPGNARYMFYLANSLRDNGDSEEAIEMYRLRILAGGWIEEIWHSHYSIGMIYKHRGDMPNAIHAWMNAYECFPERIENLYEIVNYYRCIGKCKLAYPFYVLAKHELMKRVRYDYLFTKKDIYDYKMDYEMTIIGYYCNTDSFDLKRLCMKVLCYPHLPDSFRKNIMSNYKFYTKAICDIAITIPRFSKLFDHFSKIKLNDNRFRSSSPCILRISRNTYAVCIRFVNYYYNNKGVIVNASTIESKNILAIFEWRDESWICIKQTLVKHDTTYDTLLYVGIEDIRIRCHEKNYDEFQYTAKRTLSDDGRVTVEMGIVNDDGCINNTVFTSYPGNWKKCEKNWVFITESNGDIQKMIYQWFPLTIGTVDPTSGIFEKIGDIEMPTFFQHVRGSTNGVRVGNEIWFLSHVVSCEDIRYYYHIVVVLSSETYRLLRYSHLFTFEKIHVEYTLGFTYEPDEDVFLIGYSLRDGETKYMCVSRKSIEDDMILSESHPLYQ
jgi:tetratricopeptide (TPR) repeat protein